MVKEKEKTDIKDFSVSLKKTLKRLHIAYMELKTRIYRANFAVFR